MDGFDRHAFRLVEPFTGQRVCVHIAIFRHERAPRRNLHREAWGIVQAADHFRQDRAGTRQARPFIDALRPLLAAFRCHGFAAAAGGVFTPCPDRGGQAFIVLHDTRTSPSLGVTAVAGTTFRLNPEPGAWHHQWVRCPVDMRSGWKRLMQITLRHDSLHIPS
jgi:hypothetical protein